MPVPETTPSLSIYRPVLNFDQIDFDGLNQLVSKNGIGIRTYHEDPNVYLLRPEELQAFLHKTQAQPSEEDLTELGDFILENLPSSTDKVLSDISVLPINERAVFGRKSAKLFTIAGNNPIIREERSHTLSLIEQFFEVLPAESDNLWQEDAYISEIWIGQMARPKSVEVFRGLLDSVSALLPEMIYLDTVMIDDV